MKRAELPVLRCESRRRHPLERGLGRWTFAILLVASAFGDGVIGAWDDERVEAVEETAPVIDRRQERVELMCHGGLCGRDAAEIEAIRARVASFATVPPTPISH